MKRQTQELGIRDWYGDAFVALQAEPLKVIDSFFSQYGAFVLSGCEVSVNGSKFDIAPGLVVLEGAGAGNTTVKVVAPFDGIKATALPVYLTLGYETETDVYHDGNVKPITDIYKAVATTVKPAGSYVQIIQSGAVRFIDAIQDPMHRFITDSERSAWNKAIQDVAKYTSFDYVIDSNAALAGLNNNANATCVLIKKGTWTAPLSGILLHPNTKRIVGEPGSIIRYSGAGLACFYYADVPDAGAGYNIQGVTVAMTNIAVGFYQMVNMENCVCECAKVSSQEESSCFHTCSSLTHCGAFLHERYHAADGFYLCENLVQCKVQSDKTGNYALGIRQCNGVVQCYSDCSIDGCCNVFMCKTNLYVGSYYSSTENTTYRCADTLNGGWNKTITV